MKNLFKTLITVITVVCMLASMTAFAATQSTVTSYVSDTSVNVVSTVKDVEPNVIVTYLAAKDDGDGVIAADEIKYINQKTSDGEDVVFEYAISDVEGWDAEEVISNVQYGSNADLDIAKDQILFDDITFSVTCGGVVNNNAAYLSVTKVGKGDEVDVYITPELGYEIVSVTIDGAPADVTTGTYKVAYGQTVEVTVEEVSSTKVYLFDDVVANDGLDIYYEDTKLNVLTGVACFVGGPVKSASIVFDQVNVDGAHPDFTYAAADVTGNSGYFAVQLAQAEAFAEGAKATDAIVTTDEGTFKASEN